MRTFIIVLLLCSTLQAQGWDAVKAVPPGTLLRVNSSITARLDSVDDTQITLNGRRLRQDVIRRVERVESRRKRNAGLALLGGCHELFEPLSRKSRRVQGPRFMLPSGEPFSALG